MTLGHIVKYRNVFFEFDNGLYPTMLFRSFCRLFMKIQHLKRCPLSKIIYFDQNFMKLVFFTSEQPKRYKLWSCQEMCDTLRYLLDNIFIRFGSKLYRQIVGIPMGTNCAPLVADLFLFCCLCRTIIKLILLKLLTQPPDI